MMIHAALRWTYASERILWNMAMDHYVHLNNHSPGIYSVMYPEEFWTRSNYSHSALQNSHTWECPVYDL